MGKRKRDNGDGRQQEGALTPTLTKKKPVSAENHAKQPSSVSPNDHVCIQIITGSYDRVLHGLTATLDLALFLNSSEDDSEDLVSFTDTFLFSAHSSSVRCLALSPMPSTPAIDDGSAKLTLASGGSDERINLYSISAYEPTPGPGRDLIKTAVDSIAKTEDSKNREVGSLLHHSSAVTKLRFATRSKLLSGSEDNTVAISRSRDWTVLSTMKAPIPQAHGRPSGDTAAAGKTPAGINDFDIDPSLRIMITVGKGERCMRLWNLVTGKKAGALNFGKDLLQEIGEDKSFSGEGRHVLFKPNGEGFVIAFERAAVVFNMQSEVRGLVIPEPRSKIHQLRFLPQVNIDVLCVSTEDGRIELFDTSVAATAPAGKTEPKFDRYVSKGHIGGPAAGVAGRVKDFEIVPLAGNPSQYIIVTAGSDGSIRLWHMKSDFQSTKIHQAKLTASGPSMKSENGKTIIQSGQIGRLIGRFESTNRITCLKAFSMLRSKVAREIERKSTTIARASSSDEFEGFE